MRPGSASSRYEPFDLSSERYRPEGGAGGDAVRRAIGRPRLDRISVLIREAVQNAWDARRPRTNGVVHFGVRLEKFDDEETN